MMVYGISREEGEMLVYGIRREGGWRHEEGVRCGVLRGSYLWLVTWRVVV
jgi:hypothetical protein